MTRHPTIPILFAALLAAAPGVATAQSAPETTSAPDTTSAPRSASRQKSDAAHKKKPGPNNYGSPLDTIMSTRLWTDVPPAQGFVKETRPNPKDLDYTPLTGKDPERPKPRNAADVAALQAELEADGARNEKKARGLRGPLPAAAPHRAKRAAPAE